MLFRSKHLVIDGQQRLTTIALLLCALRRILDGAHAARIEDYLVNRHYQGPDHFKLVPTNADRDAFCQMVKMGDCPESNVLRAVRLFEKKLQGDDLDDAPIEPTRVLETLEQCLQVVMINLGETDDPYLIFESLNYKGEPLTQADLVRNYVLMRFSHSLEPGGEQELVYSQLWRPIELSLGEHLTEFLRHYSMKDGELTRKGGIYASTKARFTSLGDLDAVRAELVTMRHHSDAYSRIANPEREARPSISLRLSTFRDFDVTTCYPLLLRLFEFNRVGAVTDDELEKCLTYIESYIVRRAIVGVAPNVLNRLFVTWSKNISTQDVSKQLHGMIIGTTGRGRWPKDEEVKPAFVSQSQYGRKWTRQILVRLEGAFEHKEPPDLEDCTIEHVMPQTLSDEWVAALGVDHASIHDRSLHTIGNLTLSAYNGPLSNLPFNEKKQIFLESHLELNKDIAKQTEWSETQILNRGERLFEIANKLWPGPAAT